MHIEECLHEGVYLGFLGPTYPTISESRFARLIGADAMGMSTTHETIVAKHAGLKVFAVSLTTDEAELDYDTEVTCSHEEVLRTAATRTDVLKTLVVQMLERL